MDKESSFGEEEIIALNPEENDDQFEQQFWTDPTEDELESGEEEDLEDFGQEQELSTAE